MSVPMPLRWDFSESQLRSLAKKTKRTAKGSGYQTFSVPSENGSRMGEIFHQAAALFSRWLLTQTENAHRVRRGR